MEFRRITPVAAPNVWCRAPVLDVEVAGAPPAAGEVVRTLAGWLAGPCPALAQELGLARTPADVLATLARGLQRATGSPVEFVRALSAPGADAFRLLVEYEEEPLGRDCAETARRLWRAAAADGAADVSGELRRLREQAHEVRLGPSTAAIVGAARARDIPVRRINAGSIVQLGWGARQRRIWAAETDRTGAVAELVAQDKELTRSLLRAVGVPVPAGRPVADADDAWRAAEEVGVPVVVKPQHGNHGRGVATKLTTRGQVERAYAAARREGPHVIVETFAPGADFRLLVVGGRLIAAALREPAHVIGDGRSTVRELIEQVNRDPRRSDGHATVLSTIKLDPVALAVLEEQGHSPDTVPTAGVRVLVRRNANLSTGGTATDVTDLVHPDVAARAVDAARAVGLDVAGVDVIATDVGRPLEAQRGVVVEVNAGPGLRMHLEPSAGKPRPVGQAIVDLILPPGQTGRIPVAVVTGGGDTAAAARLLARVLGSAGQTIGLVCADGTFVGNRRIDPRGGAAAGADRLFLNRRVEAAVIEATPDDVVRNGLGLDRCETAVVLAPATRDREEAEAIRLVVDAVPPGGTLVLGAADPAAPALAARCRGAVVYQGGSGAAVAPLTGAAETWDGPADVSAAVGAAAQALGVPGYVIRAGLAAAVGTTLPA